MAKPLSLPVELVILERTAVSEWPAKVPMSPYLISIKMDWIKLLRKSELSPILINVR